jgi:MarR family transcriptional regulator for hemolysin
MGAEDGECSGGPTDGAFGTDLGWSLGVILRAWHQQVERVVADVPHGTRGYQILSVLGRGDSPTQKGLAEHLSIDKTVMPYVIDALEDARLVARKVDAADRRVRRIVITPRGRRVLGELTTRMRTAEQALFDDVPAPLRESFVTQAAQIATTIHHAHPALNPCIAVQDALSE